jgi:hypothetical protein
MYNDFYLTFFKPAPYIPVIYFICFLVYAISIPEPQEDPCHTHLYTAYVQQVCLSSSAEGMSPCFQAEEVH